MERIFGAVVYVVGLIIMVTMLLELMGIIDQAGPITTLLFLIFGYILCVTGYLFSRRSPTLLD